MRLSTKVSAAPKFTYGLNFAKKFHSEVAPTSDADPKEHRRFWEGGPHHVASHQDVPKMQSQDYAQSEGRKARDVP
jgi:hypothetical protein